MSILEVKNLKKYFPIREGVFNRVSSHVHAVENVNISIDEMQTFSLVGESGCGKSTTGRAILRLHEPTAGEIFFNKQNIMDYDKEQMRKMRKDMQIIFQDPYSSLNPRMTVEQLLMEPLLTHTVYSKDQIRKEILKIMEQVGLASKYVDRYPHQFSGGQRQRISIARALITKPAFVVADEPVSALDVSIQAQIINLLIELQEEMKLTYLFISHDLNVVKHISDKVAVMYLGNIVEKGYTDDLYSNPRHPYTKALLASVPNLDPEMKMDIKPLAGDVPSPVNPPTGCPFHTRCPKVMDVCKMKKPLNKVFDNGQEVACHLYEGE